MMMMDALVVTMLIVTGVLALVALYLVAVLTGAWHTIRSQRERWGHLRMREDKQHE